VQVQICCLIIFVYICTHSLVLLWPDSGHVRVETGYLFNKYIPNSVLVVTGDILDLCDLYSTGIYLKNFPQLSSAALYQLGDISPN
jgi:hypothetical protein